MDVLIWKQLLATNYFFYSVMSLVFITTPYPWKSISISFCMVNGSHRNSEQIATLTFPMGLLAIYWVSMPALARCPDSQILDSVSLKCVRCHCHGRFPAIILLRSIDRKITKPPRMFSPTQPCSTTLRIRPPSSKDLAARGSSLPKRLIIFRRIYYFPKHIFETAPKVAEVCNVMMHFSWIWRLSTLKETRNGVVFIVRQYSWTSLPDLARNCVFLRGCVFRWNSEHYETIGYELQIIGQKGEKKSENSRLKRVNLQQWKKKWSLALLVAMLELAKTRAKAGSVLCPLESWLRIWSFQHNFYSKHSNAAL